MRILCGVMILSGLPGVAGAGDYDALAAELADLKADADVQVFFSVRPRDESRLAERERAMREDLQEVADSRAEMGERRRRNAVALLAVLSGDEELRRASRDIRSDTSGDGAIERHNRALERRARETLAGLVEDYRAIKARVQAVREEVERREAEKAAAPKPPKKQR